MAPIIGKGDKFIADMRWRGPLRPGEMIIVDSAEGIRGGRIAATAGDRIAMRSGVPVVNGNAAVQTREGQVSFVGSNGLESATLLTEHLPGEAPLHRVLESGPSQFDDMQQVLVPAGHVFILGDNRDSAADSRVPPDLGGLGMVPLSAVVGRQMYIYWSSDRSRIGRRLDR
jgi:signal peptidase I